MIIKKRQVGIDRMITLNPVLGCPIGCPYCYARKMNQRFKFTPDFSISTKMTNALNRLKTIHNKDIFMTSMSDFSYWDPDWRDQVFEEMKKNTSNQYLFLTKNPKGLAGFDCSTFPNVWIGVTVTRNIDLHRLTEILSSVKARHYWINFEPLHEDINPIPLNVKKRFDWVVIGDETGNRAGKIVAKDSWIINLANQFPNIPVCMKERLQDSLGDEWRSESPSEF